MDLLEKQLSPESKVKIEVLQGEILFTSDLDTEGVDAALRVAIDADYFLDELAKKIPGQIDDAVIQLMKQALKAL